MSTEFRAVKRLGALRPATDCDAEIMQGLPEGTPIKLVATVKMRGERFHRWYFGGFLKTVSRATGYNIDQLQTLIKVGIGHVETIVVPWDSRPVYRERSISFASMDEEQFREFVNKAIDFVILRLLPGCDRDDLINEVYIAIGIDLSNLRDRRAA